MFIDKRRKLCFQQPPSLAKISRVDVIKILGVTVTNTLSVHEHVINVIFSCSQSVYALQILRTHGMTAASVHIIFKTVVVSKLVCAASSRWGFATADDQKRLQGVIRRGIRSGLCEQHHKTVEELVEEADDKLFTSVMYNKQHVLRPTLPGTMDTKYHLRPRPTTLSSPQRTDLSLNAILLLGCFLKTFIDIMFFSLLFFCTYAVIISRFLSRN